MAIKTILFLGAFVACAVGALFAPLLGVIGYMAHYCTGPEFQWWAEQVKPWGIRYSLILATATTLGFLLNYRKLRFGRTFLVAQERLILLFLGVVWLSVVIGEETVLPQQASEDPPAVKMTKVLLFALIMTHIVTTMRDVNIILWLLVVAAAVLGQQAYETPSEFFQDGRLESVGGPDFHNSNRLAGFLGALLFVIGAQFLRTRWLGRLLCLVAGAMATNAIILARSRGAVLGIVAGAIVGLVLAPRKWRPVIALGLIAAGLGGFFLSDPGFLERVATISAPEGERDVSAQSRVEIWQGGLKMLIEHPMGVGAGNFQQAIGRYAPEHPFRDAHNTLVLCAGELGFPGLVLFVAAVVNAFVMLRRTIKQAAGFPPGERTCILWASYGILTGLMAFFVYGMTGSLLYTEGFWWFLVFPVCLARVVENTKADQAAGLSKLRAGGD